ADFGGQIAGDRGQRTSLGTRCVGLEVAVARIDERRSAAECSDDSRGVRHGRAAAQDTCVVSPRIGPSRVPTMALRLHEFVFDRDSPEVAMADVLVEFDTAVLGADGTRWVPRVWGDIAPDGLWEGWIEFT